MRPNIPKVKDGTKDYYRGHRLTPSERMMLQFRDAEWDDYINQERADLVRCVLECFLYTCSRRYHLGKNGMRKLYEDAIHDIWESRALFREYGVGPGYQLQRTGHNVENVYYREELRKLGVDVAEWENGVAIKDTDITFGNKGGNEK